MKILAIWITKGLFIFVVCIAEWNVCSNLVKRTVFNLKINVEKGKEYTTRIDYSSIKGSLLFSDVTWSNSLNDNPIYVRKYRDGSNGCIRSCNHSWNITQSVTFVIVVLYI